MANNNDFMTMQREAERRVMEMRQRAKSTVENHPQPAPPPPPSAPPAKGNSLLNMLNLKTFFEGKDTSLVLMVLALMNSEDTDPLLLLALLYVIM